MKDNPLHKEGKSKRRKIVDTFEINLNRCILCGICVTVCNFDAIVMSHEHEMSVYERNGDRVDLIELLEMGKRYQDEQDWVPPSTLRKKAAPTRRRRPAARRPRPTKKAAQEEKAKPKA
jgi:formate hydrogenlyase subunit 6/NADH:ubiquinone oxidoreductase subunit I